jgi:GDPmannose 4,6-dehydratase
MEIYKGITNTLITPDINCFHPVNPYGIAKLSGHWTIRYYRDILHRYMCTGIIFNAESPRRKDSFLAKKVANGINRILYDKSYVLTVGNIKMQRDWMHAYDVAMAAWLILQQDIPQDYVICNGVQHSVKKLISEAFALKNIYLNWIDSQAFDKDTDRLLVTTDSSLYRSYESTVDPIFGDNERLCSIGWKPKYSFHDIIRELLD